MEQNIIYDFRLGYPQFKKSTTQRAIGERHADFEIEAENRPRTEIEKEFLQIFAAMRKQPDLAHVQHAGFSNGASIFEYAIALYCKHRGWSVAQIYPCLDSVHAPYQRLGIEVQPLNEEIFCNADNIYQQLERIMHADVLFLVTPNNPTGSLNALKNEKMFREILRFAKEHGKTLAFDFSFTALVDLNFDAYELLRESGVSYFAIEDSGKLFPTQNVKISFLACSDNLASDAEVHKIVGEFIQFAPPAIIAEIREYCRDAAATDLAQLKSITRQNCAYLQMAFSNTYLHFIEPEQPIPFAWLYIDPKLSLCADELKDFLHQRGIDIWSGSEFYWGDDPNHGQTYIRIALSRDPGKFKEGIDALKSTLGRLLTTNFQMNLTRHARTP